MIESKRKAAAQEFEDAYETKSKTSTVHQERRKGDAPDVEERYTSNRNKESKGDFKARDLEKG